jgi:hypothetical protein
LSCSLPFLSYSHLDEAFARALASALRSAGIDLFFDQRDLHVGDLLLDRVMKAIALRDYIIALISRNSVKSRWVREELCAAFEKGENAILI